MNEPAKITFRGVCLYVRGPGSLTVVFPQTSGGQGDCHKRGKHHIRATKWIGDTLGPIVPLEGESLFTKPGERIILSLENVFNLGRVVQGTAAKLKRLQIGNGIACIVKLEGGMATAVDPEVKVPDVRFQLRNLDGSTDEQPEQPALEVEWVADDGDDFTLSFKSNRPPISVSRNQELIIGHFDKESDAVLRRVKDRECEPPFVDLDFYWLYQLLDNFDPNAGTLPTLDAPLSAPTTSTCFGGTWPRD